MLILLNKVILHILDFNSGVMVFSEQELERTDTVEIFLQKHVEKSFNNQDVKQGRFYENSTFQQKMANYLNEAVDFVYFSKQIAELLYDSITKAEELASADLLVADLTIEDERYIAVLKCNNRMGFIHQVVQDGEVVKNDIINHYAILPSLTQKIDEYAFVNVQSEEIKLVDKKYTVNGETVNIMAEQLLQCHSELSAKDSIKIMHEITKKVAEKHGKSPVEAITKVKNYLLENSEIDDNVMPQAIAEVAFQESPLMQREYNEEIVNAGLSQEIQLDKELTVKKNKVHKIKTDTGIEITVPIDYFKNKDYIEFINNFDGTLSINLKNIGKLINK